MASLWTLNIALLVASVPCPIILILSPDCLLVASTFIVGAAFLKCKILAGVAVPIPILAATVPRVRYASWVRRITSDGLCEVPFALLESALNIIFPCGWSPICAAPPLPPAL